MYSILYSIYIYPHKIIIYLCIAPCKKIEKSEN